MPSPDLFSYAATAYQDGGPGYKERGGASQEAAQSVRPKAAAIRALVRALLDRTPEGLTAPAVRRIIGKDRVSLNSARSRLSELCLPDDDGRVAAYKRSKRRPDPEADFDLAVYRSTKFKRKVEI